MFDLLVIGGGLAGTIAALEARASGARVALCTRSWGATALSTGALDVAFAPGSEPTQRRSIAGHAHAIANSRARHPYAVLGADRALNAMTDGLERLTPALEAAGLVIPPIDSAKPNGAYVSSLGALVPAATSLMPHAWPVGGGRLGIVQLAGDASFDARHIAKAVTHDARQSWGWDLSCDIIAVRYDGSHGSMAVARGLDDLGAAERLAAELKDRTANVDCLVLPPVLGLVRYREVLAILRAAVKVPVIEALAHLPSVPGVRLQNALDRALREADVTILGEVSSAETHGGRVTAVLSPSGERLMAHYFVLASGRFISGGIVFDTKVREPLFDLPTVSELGLIEKDAPQGVVRADPRESHPLMTAGVDVNRTLQPMSEGRVAFGNLFAAGMVIGGFASRFALCADGVALATGVIAARSALGATKAAA
ncbi:MAG: FAD-binding protein [Clostridia bacterium]|nr:FAD-binding protein [Deltaproteobacteria bacterium]